MNPLRLTHCEIRHRWKTSLLTSLLVAILSGTLTYFAVNNAGFQKEIIRNSRDIGSNVVILPANVDQLEYHSRGGYSEKTMTDLVMKQIMEYRASLNHLIPMLERKASISIGDQQADARLVGISASVPVPGRPKSPMQKSLPKGKVQLGSELARQLGIDRDSVPEIKINGQPFSVSRVNRSNGTWQDGAALIDLKSAQDLFQLPGQISRIEAVECTSAKCAETGLKSEVVLANELASITDQATLLRREKIAAARTNIRHLSHDNLNLLQNVLWVLLALGMISLTAMNAFQRTSEVGVLQAMGYGPFRVVLIFLLRAVWLTILGALLGVTTGALMAYWQSRELFLSTGNKFMIDWSAAITIGIVAVTISAIAACVPTILAAMKHPSELIGKQ